MVHLLTDNLFADPRSKRQFPAGCYTGFRLGGESHHVEVFVLAGGARYRLSAQEPLEIEPFEGQPIIEPAAVTWAHAEGAGAESRAHVVGLTCGQAPRRTWRHPWTWEGDLDSGSGTDRDRVLLVPFRGRRHARIYVDAGLLELTVIGQLWQHGGDDYGADFDPLGTEAAGKSYLSEVTLHESGELPEGGYSWDQGGTNEEELFDCLAIEVGDGASSYSGRLRVDVYGEAGD